MKPTLLILAAGMGSRYGGLKQLDAMGPSGQTMLDYAVLDAIHAGFGKVVFVIRKDFEADFRAQVGQRYEDQIETVYAFQQLDDLPQGFDLPAGRTKPWGTAHAVRAARGCIAEPFAAINADDFYGRQAYTQMARHLSALDERGTLHLSMVGYRLENTLSPHGSVNRGVCQLHGDALQSVEEYTKICRDPDGVLRGDNLGGERTPLNADAVVSMNFWGFTPEIFTHLEAGFVEFLNERIQEEKSEYYIPTIVDELIQAQVAECPVLKTNSPWFGITYPEDKPRVVASIQKLTNQGIYPG